MNALSFTAILFYYVTVLEILGVEIEYTAFKHKKTGRYLSSGGFCRTGLNNNDQLFDLYQREDGNRIIYAFPWLDAGTYPDAMDIEGGCKTNANVTKFQYHGALNQLWRTYSDGTIGSDCQPEHWRLIIHEYLPPWTSHIHCDQIVIDKRVNSSLSKGDLEWERVKRTRFYGH